MTLNDPSSVEGFIRDRLCGGITHHTAATPGVVRKKGHVSGLGWHFLAPRNLARLPHDVMVDGHVREALIRLNPEIAGQPDRAKDVLHRLRDILMGVRSDGLVNANEEFAAWLRGDRSMPFGDGGEHVPIRLIDFLDLERNQYVVTTHFTCRAGASERCTDLVLLVNGMPLIVIEAKTPVRARGGWYDAGVQIHDDYERNLPELFVPNTLSIATEGQEFRYGSIGLPVELWGPWRTVARAQTLAVQRIGPAIESMLRPTVILDLLSNFTAYATDTRKRRIKILARHEQYEATNAIVERVVASHPRKDLICHFRGSGTLLLMLFAARKLRLHPALKNHTVMIVVYPNDLDSQISSIFYAADSPNLVKADSWAELHHLLAQDTRKIIITTIFTFAERGGVLNDRTNIVAMVYDAHRTQVGNLGRRMRDGLPNACFCGLTGMPANRAGLTTGYAFGTGGRPPGYMNRYEVEDGSATALRCRCTSSRACRSCTSIQRPWIRRSRHSLAT